MLLVDKLSEVVILIKAYMGLHVWVSQQCAHKATKWMLSWWRIGPKLMANWTKTKPDFDSMPDFDSIPRKI